MLFALVVEEIAHGRPGARCKPPLILAPNSTLHRAPIGDALVANKPCR